jgi:hypothetical protein
VASAIMLGSDVGEVQQPYPWDFPSMFIDVVRQR